MRKFVYGSGIDEVISLTDDLSLNTYYYSYDGLGSVTEITDAAGTVVEKYEYDVYGNTTIRDASDVVITASTIGNPYGFTGRRIDHETGLFYYQARMYSPALGRFLQTDPIGYWDSVNLYNYVNNNPLRFSDPFGLRTYSEEEIRQIIEDAGTGLVDYFNKPPKIFGGNQKNKGVKPRLSYCVGKCESS
ncbi:MAG: RHS repeat-associated core domain-containing protein [Candidatus Omnitrophota bacterium]